MFKVLSRISLEITLGLLSALTGDLYSACRYWLQSLSQCNKHCLFALQRQLCCILLPHGSESLKYLLRLSQEVCTSNVVASDDPKKAESVEKLFLHFHAHYCKAVLIEIWYRCPDVLEIFYCYEDVAVEDRDGAGNADNRFDPSAKVVDPANTLLPESAPSKFGNSSVISDCNRISDNDTVADRIEIGGGDAVGEVVESKACDPKEPFSSTKHNLVRKQDLMSTLENVKAVLLSDHQMKISNLRELLTEIRKAMLLKRSKQFMLAISSSNKLSQKKKKHKQLKGQPAHSSEPQGFSPSCSGGDPTSETASRGSSVELAECNQTEPNEDDNIGDTVYSESLVEETGIKTRDDISGGVIDDEAERDKEINNEFTAENGPGVIPASEATAEKLTTAEGKLPVDLRYITNDTSLELLTEEEKQVLNELEGLEFKVCNINIILLLCNLFKRVVEYWHEGA